MAFVLADKVREAVNAPGTSDFELLGPPPSADTLTFASQIGDGNTTRYQAWGAEGWEIGIGTVSTGATNRLLRPGTVLVNSSGGTSLIDFQGTVQVACVFSTADLPYLDENGDLPARGGRDLGTSGDPWRKLWLDGDLRMASGHIYRVAVDGSSFVISGGNATNDGSNVLLNDTNAQDLNGRLRWGGKDIIVWSAEGAEVDTGLGMLPVSTVSKAFSISDVDFPIGHLLAVQGSRVPRNNLRTITTGPSDHSYSVDGGGVVLSGSWRSRGAVDADCTLYQRYS